MHLETIILVSRTPEEVWSYLSDYSNVPQWDRGVESVRHNPATAPGVGFEFSTFGIADKKGAGPERGKMSYRVSKADPVEGATVELTNSDGNARYFKRAEWRFKVDPAPEGAWITCAAHFTLRFRYIFLAPVFSMMKGAIQRDLESLKRVLESV
ncbi:MAG: SRPBCC family protein [Acidobacteriales bacterium]|nr:SRPBCC family protein [Terriglobales bacterium]